MKRAAFKLQLILKASATRYQYRKALQAVNTSNISASESKAETYLSWESWSTRGPWYNIYYIAAAHAELCAGSHWLYSAEQGDRVIQKLLTQIFLHAFDQNTKQWVERISG